MSQNGADIDREVARNFRRLLEQYSVPMEIATYVLPVISAVGFALMQVAFWFILLGAIPLILEIVALGTRRLWGRMLGKVEATRRALLTDTTAPIARTVAGMHDLSPRRREEAFKRVARQVIDAVILTNEAVGLRAVVYSLNRAASGLYVVDQNSRGRRSPAGNFEPGEAKTAAALARLAGGEALFVKDCAAVPEPEGGVHAEYNTYLAVPIASDAVSYGMLTVDAPSTGDLTKEHVNDAELLASVLAGAFAAVSGEAPRRTIASPRNRAS